MSPERRAEIRVAVEKAAKGPWHADCWSVEPDFRKHAPGLPRHRWVNIPNNQGIYDRRLVIVDACGTDDDARFIAGAREWIPALLDEVERLQSLIHKYALVDEAFRAFATSTLRAPGTGRGPNPAVVAQATYEATRCPRCHELQCICATLTSTEDPPHAT